VFVLTAAALITFSSGCAPSSKFIVYRPPLANDNYIIEVKRVFPATQALYINDTYVTAISWGMSYTEEAKGSYLGKPVTMKGQFYPGGRTIIDVEISGERAAQIDMN